MANLKKKNYAFMQQRFKLEEEWKVSMEAKVNALMARMIKVDSMVESMVEIKAMLEKKHGHPKALTYTNPPSTIKKGVVVANDDNAFKEMATMLVPSLATLVPTPPSFKLDHFKLTTTAPLVGIGEEQSLVMNTSPQHLAKGGEEGEKVEMETARSTRLDHLEDSDALDFNVTQKVDPKDLVVIQEQEGNEIDGIYVHVS
ncbi:unnamed protein product [Sphagnum jensenii]|uniref:Uncharacterized protein n=1 Tax=Sphagnum jensenii TaxID=128206 RepID=A0ABP1B6A3_9BRYO